MRLSNRSVFSGLALAAFGLLGAGLILGEVARLHPCHYCNFQRLLYIVAGVFALCGVLLPGWRRCWSLLVLLTALGGVVTAAKQSWMQYAPQDAIECGFGDPTVLEQVVNWLGVQWPAMFMVTGFCTQKEWSVLGLSLANWSISCFSALAAGAFWLFLRRDVRRWW